MFMLGEMYSGYSILKEISLYLQKRKTSKETNFGILIQDYFNKKQLSESFFNDFRGEFIEKHKYFKSPDDIFNALNKKCFDHTVKRDGKVNNKRSITISKIIKALKGTVSDDDLKKTKKDLEYMKPLLLSLEESTKSLPSDQDLDDVKNLLINVDFSDDDNLNRKFKRSFFLFIEAYEKTPVHIKFLQSYLTNNTSSNYSNIVQSMIEQAKENPLESLKKRKVISEGFDLILSNQKMRKTDLEKHIRAHEKDKIKAKNVTKSFFSFKYFIETNHCAIFLF